DPVPLSRRGIFLLFIGLGLSVFVSVLDETIVATAAIKLTTDFDAFNLYSWVPVSYLVAINAAQPLYGRISDIFGRRPFLLTGLCIFAIGSAGCGWAPTMPVFLAARAIAGLGAGGLVSMTYIIIADIFPIEEGPKWKGLLGFAFGFAATLGPVLGGVFTTKATWRWCFWINLPVVAITVPVVLLALRLPAQTIPSYRAAVTSIDFIGAFLLVITITSFILPLSLGGSYWSWNSPQVIVLFVASPMLVSTFLLFQRHGAKAPLIPWRLLTNKHLLATWGVLFFYGMCFMSYIYFLPIWYQIVLGNSPIIAGLQLLPILCARIGNGLAYRFTIKLAARLSFAPLRTMLTAGALLLTMGTILVGTTFSPNLAKPAEIIILIIFGIGCGLTLQTSFMLAQIAVDKEDLAIANSLTILFQNLGDVVGLAVSGAIHRGYLQSGFTRIPEVPQAALSAILSNPEFIHELPDSAKAKVVEQFVMSLRKVFQMAILYSCFAGLAGIMTRAPPIVAQTAEKREEDNNEASA
ncbi:major facilitator superfamily domain-containing protein, partial [Mycena floridula]